MHTTNGFVGSLNQRLADLCRLLERSSTDAVKATKALLDSLATADELGKFAGDKLIDDKWLREAIHGCPCCEFPYYRSTEHMTRRFHFGRILFLKISRTAKRQLEEVIKALIAIVAESDHEQDRSSNLRAAKQQIEQYSQIWGMPVPRARSQSGSVVLYSQSEAPIVSGKTKSPLTHAAYEVVMALLEAGQEGLTKETLAGNSHHGGARAILTRLVNSDPDWKAVVQFPKTTGKRYRIL